MTTLIPLPSHVGVGFTSKTPLDVKGYDYRPLGIYHNYHFTKANHAWPQPFKPGDKIIDGFSPNLNKVLHAGHLKNLAVATAIANISCSGKAVAMLGASLGIEPDALTKYENWCHLANYSPDIYLDTELPPPNVELTDGEGEFAGCKTYNGVVVYKSDGKPTYAAHDLSFASKVHPDYYLTGAEQQAHFASLGLGDKHIPLGLLLGADGKKLKSRTGDALSAQDLLDATLAALKPTPEPTKVAWNILAWQFNSSATHMATKFNPDQWTKPESPGMYITYTYARCRSAIVDAVGRFYSDNFGSPETEEDALLMGFANYYHHYFNKAKDDVSPSYVAQFALTLAKHLSGVYSRHTIVGAPPGFIHAFEYATEVLGYCMGHLSMYRLEKV